MKTLIQYARHRYFSKSRGWGKAWFKWLWLDAVAFALARYITLHNPLFRRWCRQVDGLFREQYDWSRSYTQDTGLDCWIDSYWHGMSPQDAVLSEVDHWN